MNDLERIVRELAELNTITIGGRCCLCLRYSNKHVDGCVSRLAKEWVAANPKPSPRLRPWTQDDVPLPVCWIRPKDAKDVANLVTAFNTDSLSAAYWGAIGYIELAEKWEYTTDGKTWRDCVVEEV